MLTQARCVESWDFQRSGISYARLEKVPTRHYFQYYWEHLTINYVPTYLFQIRLLLWLHSYNFHEASPDLRNNLTYRNEFMKVSSTESFRSFCLSSYSGQELRQRHFNITWNRVRVQFPLFLPRYYRISTGFANMKEVKYI